VTSPLENASVRPSGTGPENPRVGGSIPSQATKYINDFRRAARLDLSVPRGVCA